MTLWGAHGERLGTFSVSANYVGNQFGGLYAVVKPTLTFAGRKIWEGGYAMVQDRLGTAAGAVTPYGISTTMSGSWFATYYHDGFTGLDYADQRYYASSYGRFNSPDRTWVGTVAGRPSSWNRYSYVEGDPASHADPSGMFLEADPGPAPDPEPTPIPSRPAPPEPADPPAWQEEWGSFSPECQKGLMSKYGLSGNPNNVQIQLMVAAVDRANGQMEALQGGAIGTGISPDFLAAIGIEETGFQNIKQGCQSGVTWSQSNKDCSGDGIFQIDLAQNPSVSQSDAENTLYAASWAASYLGANMNKLGQMFPNLTPTQLLQATAASYNLGLGGISGNPATIDLGTQPYGNYGSTVLGIMKCFQ